MLEYTTYLVTKYIGGCRVDMLHLHVHIDHTHPSPMN